MTNRPVESELRHSKRRTGDYSSTNLDGSESLRGPKRETFPGSTIGRSQACILDLLLDIMG